MDHGFANFRVGTDDQSKHILRIALGRLEDVLFIHHLVGDFGHRNGTKWRNQRWLPDHRVAARGRVRQHDDLEAIVGYATLCHCDDQSRPPGDG